MAGRRVAPAQVAIVWAHGRPALADARVRAAVGAAFQCARHEPRPLSVVFVSDRTLAAMHGTYLSDPAPTDVMAFDLSGLPGGPDGEVYVSVERARAESARRSLTLERELTLYLVHGVLHLCGFADDTPRARARMRAAEARALASLGHPPAIRGLREARAARPWRTRR